MTESSAARRQGLRILRLYHAYRIIVGLTLTVLISLNLDQQLLELASPWLFQSAGWTYLIVNVCAAVLVRNPERVAQTFALALTDITLLATLFYAAGGTPSGIGNLLIVAVAIANFMLRGRIGLVLAAVAASALIYLTFYLSLSRPEAAGQFVQVGALGALCFAAALFVQALSNRLRQSERLAAERAAEVASLEAINAQILERMRTGILVMDAQHQVLQANQSALSLLGHEQLIHRQLDPLCPQLLTRLEHWQQNPSRRPDSLQAYSNGPALQPSFVPLHGNGQRNILIFLEDISQIAQQAQQLKLASLGRLTAGIAHEIRNPLGAISHAAQLLLESEALPDADTRLAQIIQDQSRRMNLIIENILQLSRRRQAEPQLLDLKYWLHRFASEFRETASAEQHLHIQTEAGTLQTHMDPQQLSQVLNNLLHNGLRYSARQNSQAQVWMRLFRNPESDLPTLEVLDDGAGVPAEQQQHIFEPFHTTESKGTGLGLYISRELCESNQARLDYQPREGGGSCFRITFAHPRRLS